MRQRIFAGLMLEQKGKIADMPGMETFDNLVNEAGSGDVISVVENLARSDANVGKVKAL